MNTPIDARALSELIVMRSGVVNTVSLVNGNIILDPVFDFGDDTIAPAMALDRVEDLIIMFSQSRQDPPIMTVASLSTFEIITQKPVHGTFIVSATINTDTREIYINNSDRGLFVLDYDGNLIREVVMSQLTGLFDISYSPVSKTLWGWGVLGLTEVNPNTGEVTAHQTTGDVVDQTVFLGVSIDSEQNVIVFSRGDSDGITDGTLPASIWGFNISRIHDGELPVVTRLGEYIPNVSSARSVVDVGSDPRFRNNVTEILEITTLPELIGLGIKSTVTHTRTKPVIDGSVVRELFSNRSVSTLWAGVPQTFFVLPTSNGTPVLNDPITEFNFTTSDDITLIDQTSLSSHPYSDGCRVDECNSFETGVALITLKANLEGGVIKTIEEGCDAGVEIPIPQSDEMEFTITINDQNITSVVEVCANEPHLPIQTIGGDNFIFDEMVFLDCKNTIGQSIHFEQEDSRLAQIMRSIFDGEEVRKISRDINAHNENIDDLNTMRPEEFNSKLSLLGCETIDEFENLPTEISELVQIASIDHSNLFSTNIIEKSEPENRGTLLSDDSVIYVGETLWYQPFDQPSGEVNCLVVPDLYTTDNLSDVIDYSELQSIDSYTIAELDVDFVDEQTTFWRKGDNLDPTTSGHLDTSVINEIPTIEEWCGDGNNLVVKNIQAELIRNLT